MKLTPGNTKVLLALEKWGILGLGQMDGILGWKELEPRKRIELFFNALPRNGYRGTTYKAMIRVEEAGWVTPKLYTNLPRLYTLAGRGYKKLKAAGLTSRDGFYWTVAESLVRHELIVSGVGLVMSEVLGLRVSTETERYLASDLKKKSFGLRDVEFSDLWIEDPVQPKAVEVERTQKSRTRYKKLWQDYRKDLPANAVVIYVVCFPGGVNRLLHWARAMQADHVYFCDLEGFKSSLGRGPFMGYRGGWITLEPAADRPQAPAVRRVQAGQDSLAEQYAQPSLTAVGTHSLELLQQGVFASPPRPYPLPAQQKDWRSN